MGAISLVSILAETGVAALSALGQGAMFVADNLDFILPVLAAELKQLPHSQQLHRETFHSCGLH